MVINEEVLAVAQIIGERVKVDVYSESDVREMVEAECRSAGIAGLENTVEQLAIWLAGALRENEKTLRDTMLTVAGRLRDR